MLQRAAKGDVEFVTNSLVIAEIVWILESYYRLPSQAIQDKVLAILNTPGLEIPESEIVLQAIYWFGEKNVDFIDAFNASWMQTQSVTQVCSFDRKHFARFEGLEVVIPGEA